MAIRRKQNFLNQQRLNVPDIKSIESAISNDFDELLKGLITGQGKSYFITGFDINMVGAIGSSASGLQVIVSDSAVLHGNSLESGTFYTVPAGTPSEILNSNVNSRVTGSFVPGALNYVGLEYERIIDPTTTTQAYFWNPASKSEFTKTVPAALMLRYKFVVSSSTWAANVLPIAVVETDSSNNVSSIEDRRPMLFRLGSAGASTPDPTYMYPWTNHSEGRSENFWKSTSSTSPFRGGDKQIKSEKEWKDAIMSMIKEIKGTPYWYDINAGGSVVKLRMDLANSMMTGTGSIVHSETTAGQINWTSDIYLDLVGSRLSYKILQNSSSSYITLADNQVAYVKLIRGQNIIPNLIFTNGSSTVTSVANISWTNDVLAGDYIKLVSDLDTKYIQILSVDPLNDYTVTLAEPWPYASTGSGGYQAQYAWGTYQAVATPTTDRHIKISNREDVPFNEDIFWLFLREDNGGSIARVYIRGANGGEIEEGESKQISDNTTLELLSYVGSTGETDSKPNYTNALGVARTNIHLIDDENLTRSLKRLEQRDDIVPRVRVIDIISTSLPTGASVTIDGETLNNDDYVLFANSPIEGLYKVSGVGTSVAFEKLHSFGGLQQPVDGDLIRVEAGTEYFKTIWKRVSGYWKPLEVEDAVKEPTGFPNRTDSVISFDNGTRTFSIAPLAPATHFDIFAKGRIFRFDSAQQITIPDTEGIFFFFFETNGTLNYTTTFDISVITQKVYISNIYWDATNNEAIIIADERHGITLDGATHEYLHNLNGAVITSGGAINFSTFIESDVAAQFDGQVAGMTTDVIIDADVAGLAGNVTLTADSVTDIDGLILAWNTANPTNTLTLFSGDGTQIPTANITLTGGLDASGDLESDAQITLSNIVFRDEDIRMDITDSASPSSPFEQILDPIAEIPVFYRDGASGDWRRDATTQFPVKQGTSRIQYNNPAGPWTQVDVQEGYFVSMWVFATNNFNEPVIAILGQKEHALLSDAQAEDTYDSLSFGIMPVQEFKVLYRIIFKSSSAFANTPKAALVDVRDLRAAEDTQFAQVAPNDHGLLSGLNDADHGPTAVTTAGVVKDGGLSSFDVDLKESLDTLNKLFGQLRIKEHPSDKKRVVITGSDRVLNNGQKLIQSLKNLVLSFEGAEIDFETGDVLASDGVSPLGVNFTPATISTSEYFNYSITIIPSTVNSDNTITAQLIILPASGSNIVKASAPKASFAKGIQLGQVTVQENSGGIEDISQADISQLGTGGGSGTGTGDANSFTENLKHRLISSYYEFVTPVVFEIDEDNFENAATASFDIANGVYKFSAASQYMESIQLFDSDFLQNDNDSRQVELHAEWLNSASRDDNAVYEVSLDGTNYQSITMDRQNLSNKFTGSKLLDIPSNVVISSQASTNTNTELNASNLQSIAASFTLSNKKAAREFALTLDKLGSPSGSYSVKLCSDNSGVPGDVLYSKVMLVSSLSSGVNALTFNNFRNVLPIGTYHIVIETDATYKSSFSTGVNSLRVQTQSGGNDLVYNGSTWSAGSVDVKYTISGHGYDLRVKITSSAGNKNLKAFGIFYDEHVGVVTEQIQALQKFTFSGNSNISTFNVTRFLPNPDLLKVYDIKTGQVYRRPAFDVDGHTITFPTGTFLVPGETVELIFDQIEASGYDFSDQNANLLAANHLGSTDATVDKSMAGRGLYLRRPDGTLREICIDDNDNIVIYSV